MYQTCKNIILEMQKFQWCEICSSQINTNINELKINEIEANIKVYKRAFEEK